MNRALGTAADVAAGAWRATRKSRPRHFVERMRRDVRAVKDRDPAATSSFEIVTSYRDCTPSGCTASPTRSTGAACRCCRAGSASSTVS